MSYDVPKVSCSWKTQVHDFSLVKICRIHYAFSAHQRHLCTLQKALTAVLSTRVPSPLSPACTAVIQLCLNTEVLGQEKPQRTLTYFGHRSIRKRQRLEESCWGAAHLQLSRELNITAHYSRHSHASSSWNCSRGTEAMIKHLLRDRFIQKNEWFAGSVESLRVFSPVSCFQLYI